MMSKLVGEWWHLKLTISNEICRNNWTKIIIYSKHFSVYFNLFPWPEGGKIPQITTLDLTPLVFVCLTPMYQTYYFLRSKRYFITCKSIDPHRQFFSTISPTKNKLGFNRKNNHTEVNKIQLAVTATADFTIYGLIRSTLL